MKLKIHSTSLLGGLTAVALLLAGTSACSRSDRSSGTDGQPQTGAAASADTQQVAMQQDTASTSSTAEHPAAGTADTGVSGYQPMGEDSQVTATDTAHPSQDTVVVGDSSHVGKTGNRLEPTESSEQANADTLANQPGSERVRPPEDSTETVGVTSDMARDTTTALAQADTAAPVATDSAPPVTVSADTTPAQTDTAGQVAADTSAIQAQADTQETELAQQAPVDTAGAQVQADTTTLATTDTAAVGAAGVSPTNMATGPEAVAMISREGRRCTVVDAEEDKDARWDLAFSPASMNPCGTGTMTLPRVQSEK